MRKGRVALDNRRNRKDEAEPRADNKRREDKEDMRNWG